jgi:hypothetical protein
MFSYLVMSRAKKVRMVRELMIMPILSKTRLYGLNMSCMARAMSIVAVRVYSAQLLPLISPYSRINKLTKTNIS